MAARNFDSSALCQAQERIAAARLWIRMLLIIGFVVEFFSNLLDDLAARTDHSTRAKIY